MLPRQGGADYIGFGPIFHTATKDAGKPKGIAALREIKKLIKIPVVAIGGINIGNLRSVIDSGADAVAVSSGIIQGDIADNVIRFLDILKNSPHKCDAQKILDRPIRYMILILIIIIITTLYA